MSPVPHKDYYMKDGVSFQVEDTLFRVPRYMLENSSPVLSKMLENVGPADPPLELAEIKSGEFEDLLTFLYPLSPQLVSDISPTSCRDEQQQWISIMKLATLWDMQTIRLAAMQILSHSVRNPMTKIALGKQYNYVPWLREGFTILCVRPEPLSVAEASQLTKEDIVACAAGREGIRGLRGVTLPTRGRLSAYQEYETLLINPYVQEIVENAFHFEKEEITKEELTGAKSVSSQDDIIRGETSKDFNEASRPRFVPSVVSSVSRELLRLQQFRNRCMELWESYLRRPGVSYSSIGGSVVYDLLAGLSCLMILIIGVLVVTW